MLSEMLSAFLEEKDYKKTNSVKINLQIHLSSNYKFHGERVSSK